ncbi:GNAT family N-acetyltransferase [Pontibacter sp. 172403-2]|uniref:GNAT family N-acetyltransferase n=1 Tax=Pontibacter rufus TaxID=2791028 RepID=UPI0018AFD774|nr:GNAT family N-acetyltransferase [Pontibacter sp. 172403-2]MBF9253248.1 GNAT family N-acetyltransferase [Pontibacter sp. 172403-2]
MNNLTFSFLTAKQMPQLHQTFVRAFADYLIPIQLNEEQFRAKVKREGIEPTFCVGAFAENEMVGFILTGLGEWQGKPTAYNAGTGVIPAFRGRGLTQQLYRFLLPRLQESGVEQCLLEVIQENAPALKSYERTGFRITRSFDCFRGLKEDLLLDVARPEGISISQAAHPDWTAYTSFRDVKPSWQNMADAFKRSPEPKILLEARDAQQQLTGYVAFFSRNASIVQLAVKQDKRNAGIGTALLREVVQRTEAPALLLINVDTVGENIISYLKRRHFSRILKQYEMLLPLV